MAEFALGLTKTAVESTVSLVKSAVEEEAQLKEKVQNDLVFISGELEMVQSFFRVANNNRERTRNDQVVLTWVRQLRCLAFDVEDCVEFVLHLDIKSRWAWLQRAWAKVYCCAPPLPLDTAIAEIKQLKVRVEDVSHRNKRYNFILHDSNNKTVPAVMPPAEEPSSTAFDILRDAWKATGKWSSNMCNLQQELLIAPEGEDDHDLRVISVWGSTSTTGGGAAAAADLGMASVISKAYCDPEICEKFRSRVWVKLTHPFNHDEFVKSLLTQFCATSHQANAEFTEGNLMRAKKAMMQQMRRQRYLVVLEGVLTVAEWDVIKMYLLNSKNGSRILLSTLQLGIALLCTGEPYQVSELRNFSGDNQFLCAFSKREKTRRDIGDFYRQLLRGHGVISVWGADDDDKSNLVDILYKGIINGWLGEIEGIADKSSDHVDMLYKRRNKRRKFQWSCNSWVDVPDPSNLKAFAQRLFLNFYSDYIRASEITKVGMEGEAGLIKWCREFLFEKEDCLVVINGVRSRDDWDQIERTFFSSKATRAKAGCILVITKEESLATHCVKDHTHLAFNAKDLKADPSISTLIKKGSWHYAITGRKGRVFYDRRKDTLEWSRKFSNRRYITERRINPDEGKDDVEGFRVFTVTLDDGNCEKAVLRLAYYGGLFQQQIERRNSWVDMPSVDVPFDLTDFAWRLLLDFYSDDPQAKEDIAVGLMEGTIIDPIEKCREFLHNEKCLVVINGLWYLPDWDLIKDTFFSEPHIQSIIFVGCITVESEFYHTTKSLRLGTQTQEHGRRIDMEYRRTFSTQKHQEAIKWVETRQPVGRDSEVGWLGTSLFDKSLVSVWGIPGVGKSTLVRAVYYKQILSSSGLSRLGPYKAFAWVDVPNPFNLTEFAWRLLQDFYSDDPQAKETATVTMTMEEGRQVLIPECCKILRTGKCLVVMDGLRSKQDWDLIKATFLTKPIKGTIIVITNEEEEVAMHCAEKEKGRAINITRLEANAALNLFKKIAWKGKQLTFSDLELASIVAKCGGLPKVIAAIGEVCSGSGTRVLETLSRNFMGTLEMEPRFHDLRPLFSWMKSYFDSCSDSIKPCIFYLSIFPPAEKKNIRLRRLLWRWIAEGYCRDTSDGTTYEENWEKFISELVKLSIIQQSPSNKVFCQINGFFHEYIISRPMEDNLVFALDKGCSLNSERAGQHLTIRRSWDRSDKVVYKSIDFSRLRSLTVFGEWKSFFICSKKVNMRLLRVLDLEDAEGVTNDDLKQIAKRLTRLKFLSLRGHTNIKCLPISMGGLRQLQTLDIRSTSIVTLPLFITKLQKLRYIRAGKTEVWDWECDAVPADGEDMASSSAQAVTNLPPAATAAAAPTIGATPTEGNTDSTAPRPVLPPDTAGSSMSCNNGARTLVSSMLSKLCRCEGLDNGNGGVKVPAGIRKLAVLHTLGVVNVKGSWCKSICKELKKITQLRKLGVSGINKGNIHQFCSAISDHAHLKSLSVELDKDDDLDGLDVIPQPPKTLNSLKLYGHVNKLLVWTRQLPNLEKFKLDMTIVNPEELPALRLPKVAVIRHLRIRPIQDGELHIGSCWLFARVLEIQCSSELRLKFDGRSDTIEVLKVNFSVGSSLKEISSLSYLGCLKEVWLKGYTDEHKEYMQWQINQMLLCQINQERPALKLVQPRSS